MTPKLLKRISTVDVWYDQTSARALPEIPLTNQSKVLLPLKLEVDGVWRIKHICPNCNSETEFGRNELTLSVHQPRFIRFPSLAINYYSLDKLLVFKKLFSRLKSVKTKNDYYLSSTTYDYIMNLVYYNCLICKIHFFASCNFAYGTMGQDDREGRTLNLFLLDEIACVDIENEETLFDDLAVPLSEIL